MATMMRLSQVARKFNIGKNTIVEFLVSKGYDIQDNPNFKISQEQLNLLSKEFADSAMDKEEASGLTIGTKKKENFIIDADEEGEGGESDEEEEFLIKNVSSGNVEKEQDEEESENEDIVKPNAPKLQGIKVVGKIDLKQEKEEAEEASAKKEEPEHQSASDEPKAEEKASKEDVPEEETHNEETPELKKEEEEKVEESEEVKEETEEHHQPEASKEEEKKVQQKDQEKEEAEEAIEAEHPKEETEEAEDETEEEPSDEEDDSPDLQDQESIIEAKAETLKGLKVVGKIDLPKKKPKKVEKRGKPEKGEKDKDRPANKAPEEKKDKKKKRPRKRIQKEVKSEQRGGDSGGGGAKERKERRGGGKNKQRQRAPRKEELSDKEIQEQIKATLAKLSGGGGKGGSASRAKYRKEKRSAKAEAYEEEMMKQQEDANVLKVTEFISANDLASMMDVSVNDVISTSMNLGMFVSINQRLDAEAITFITDEFGYSVEFVTEEDDVEVEEEEDAVEELEERAPIVTIMGHVDHGKTSLLDFIRSTRTTEGEAGGITQHIGAYDVMTESNKRVAFLDTPGHEAFTAMRARGAQLTDIAVIVVAADDAVMPQTKEALNHAQVANVPIIIAINKVDKPNANPDKIKEDLANINILVEDWGGKYQCQEISAKSGQGIEELLEKILLEAELMELKANANKRATGTVVEAELDKGRGYVATVLVQTGSLKMGDVLLAGAHFGKVKAMFDHRGKKVDEAPPSTPVLVLGLDGAPQAGDKFNVMESEREAREIANKREQILREQNLRTKKHITLDEIGRRLAIGSFKELNIIVKGDVDGSVEALSDSLLKLSTEEVQINIIHKGVGQISESDVLLASASDAIICGFQVRPSTSARKIAEQEEIEIRLYSVIYDAINEIRDAMEGMLTPEVEEVITGNAEVREVFKISKVGTVAGCMVSDGIIKRQHRVRLIRDGIVTFTGAIAALKRFKEDVNEVKQGYECGISIKNFNDVKLGDVIEAFEEKEVKRKL